MQTPYGFRIVGATSEARRLIDWAAAYSAYAACNADARLSREAYLSAFVFDRAIYDRKDEHDWLDLKQYDGICCGPYIWFDIDRCNDPEAAQCDLRRLAAHLSARYEIDADELTIFFSGSKGFHLGLPTALWSPIPSDYFHRAAKCFATSAAAAADVTIDGAVYDRVRPFRAPNSQHPRSGLYKRRLLLSEWGEASISRILELCRNPEPFEPPAPRRTSSAALCDWRAAEETARRGNPKGKIAAFESEPCILPDTRRFIAEGAAEGERATRLFAAAANLSKCGCPKAVVVELLTEPALESGLTMREAQDTIRNGVRCGEGRHD